MRELACAHLLHCGVAFRVDVDRPTMLRTACKTSRRSVTDKNDRSTFVDHAPADILVLDWNAVDTEQLRPDFDSRDLLFSRSPMLYYELLAGGRMVAREDRVTGVNYSAMLDELLCKLCVDFVQNAGLAWALTELDASAARHYGSEASCC